MPALSLICVVEDDDGMRTATARYIRSLGYEVQIFESAEAYLAGAVQERHCLVCDVQMPGMSGVELYEKLRGAAQAAPPTVFITAHSPEIVKRRAWLETRTLGKPFDGADLVRCLEEVQRDR